MSDLLRKELAPIGSAGWAAIDEQARTTLRGNLSARAVVDVSGPHDWTLAAVNLGGVTKEKTKVGAGLEWGLRQVLPLAELRAAFALGRWDLDNIERGSKTPDLDPVAKAAAAAARFEEQLVYQGLAAAGVTGILPASPHAPVALPAKSGNLAETIEKAVVTLQTAGVGGPYALVAGTELYQRLAGGDHQGYPLPKRIAQILEDGPTRWSPVLKGGLVLSRRGGDFELTIGQDFSVGYAGESQGQVQLYLTESVTFRVLDGRAAVALA